MGNLQLPDANSSRAFPTPAPFLATSPPFLFPDQHHLFHTHSPCLCPCPWTSIFRPFIFLSLCCHLCQLSWTYPSAYPYCNFSLHPDNLHGHGLITLVLLDVELPMDGLRWPGSSGSLVADHLLPDLAVVSILVHRELQMVSQLSWNHLQQRGQLRVVRKLISTHSLVLLG